MTIYNHQISRHKSSRISCSICFCLVPPRHVGADLADGEGGGPLGSEDVQADGAVRVDVGVVDPGGEGHLGGREVITSNTAKTRLPN